MDQVDPYCRCSDRVSPAGGASGYPLAKYSEWIDQHYPNEKQSRFQCNLATIKMQKTFPELIRVRGWYKGMQHWWLKTSESNGVIIDPTFRQFKQPINLAGYVEFKEGIDPEPTGKCPECGEWIWNGDSFCSVNCERSYMSYLKTGRL